MFRGFVILLILFSLGCDKKNDKPQQESGTVIFYSLKASNNNKWEAHIDGKMYGLVPYTIVAPPCDNNESLGLKVTLSEGRHEVIFVSLEGFASEDKTIWVTKGCNQVQL